MDIESLEKLRSFPKRLEDVFREFSPEQINTRDKGGEGWSPAQLIHHICDAHVQAYYRIKWIVTEPYSIIKPFDEKKWADLSVHDDHQASLDILRGVCSRWVSLLESLSPDQWDKQGWHPEGGLFDVKGLLTYYVNHGEGHLERMRSAL